ncbi:MAG TPA: VOC family protein [Phycisphaerae bacterium]|jgi:uncharacterized glyoxalase superfamily protein PhnB|nr:VOC family protein [Phycisphaerae bacterium]
MITNRSAPADAVIPVLEYADVRAAAAWLCAAFGFRERLRIANHRIQLSIGEGAGEGWIVAAERRGETLGGHSVLVRVADVDAHHERAVRFGAKVLRVPESHAYGERQYSVEDPGGHRWTFSQTVMDVDPASWGGEVV